MKKRTSVLLLAAALWALLAGCGIKADTPASPAPVAEPEIQAPAVPEPPPEPEAPPEEPPAPAKQESPLDTARLRAILASPEFEAFCRGGEAALSAFGIRRDGEDSGYPDLLVWLSSFVKKNDISFDVLFREEDAL